MNSQDVAVLYTDGITEAEDIDGVQYGQKKLCEVSPAPTVWFPSVGD